MEQSSIPFKIRTFIKNIYTIQELYSWSTLKIFKNIAEPNWTLCFDILNTLEHNYSKYSFRIKMLTNNLPTIENLHIRYPYLYPTSKCSRCSDNEDTIHILFCLNNNNNIQQSITNIITNTLTFLKITTLSPTTILNILLHSTLNSPNPQFNSFLYYIIGIFLSNIFENIKLLTAKQTKLFLTTLSNNLLEWFQNTIWSSRNISQHQWEHACNITSKMKKRKYFFPNTFNTTTISSSNISHIDYSSFIEKWFLQGYSLTNCIY